MNINDFFVTRRLDKSFRAAVPRRIAYIRPFKNLSPTEANFMKVKAFDFAGLSEFNSCWTGEMAMRPIPFVSTDEKPLKARTMFDKNIGAVLRRLLPQVEPHYQPINKISSLGYPINANPGSGVNEQTGQQEYMSKFDIVVELFHPMLEGDFSTFKDAYHTMGVRKQIEDPDSTREFQFVDDLGSVFQQTISKADRTITVPGLGAMVGSRTRTVTRPPVVNLFLQCWDSMLHDAIMKHPLCDSNVYTTNIWPDDVLYQSFDCKHYERYLGLIALGYAETIGGQYGEQLSHLVHMGYVVPSVSWRTFFLIEPQFKPGVYPQFGSGLSCVAVLGKLANICAQVEYFRVVKNANEDDAVATVLSGSSPGLRRWMYGDDNRLAGTKEEIDGFTSFMADVFEIEIDSVPKYLGVVYRKDLGRWLLPKSTYDLKLYLPERDFEWKDYPNLGMVERREVFRKFGEPEIGKDIIPFEDELWNDVGHPFYEVVSAAVAERRRAASKGLHLSSLLVTDKDYLMTDAQRMATGMYWHFKPDVTAYIATKLVSTEILGQLTFRTAPKASLPEVKHKHIAYTQMKDDHEDTESSIS